MSLSHLDERGYVQMVDVGAKDETSRLARAWGQVHMAKHTIEKVTSGTFIKGDVLAAARIAGIMAAKQTATLIPLCHPLPVSYVGVELLPLVDGKRIIIVAEARVTGKTGVEMEALTAVSVAALTVYDMCKAVDKRMSIDSITLLEKYGGRSGHYLNPDFAASVTISIPLELRLGMEIRLTKEGNNCLLESQDNAKGQVRFVMDRLPGSLAHFDAEERSCRPTAGVFLLGESVLELSSSASDQGVLFLSVVKAGVVEAGDMFAALC
ncbi:MAG: cyclic pyranopterin monophosphate synthase MoaC [Deltaproteobacteria bacterium]|nr:cyclic pyranopterin monophosphate synthase MoaC [Deltaproteobacteria bacterium]